MALIFLDIIKENTTKLGFELDVHWIQRAGVNPVEFVKQYKGRISLLHLKDYRVGPMDLTDIDFEKDLPKFMDKFVWYDSIRRSWRRKSRYSCYY